MKPVGLICAAALAVGAGAMPTAGQGFMASDLTEKCGGTRVLLTTPDGTVGSDPDAVVTALNQRVMPIIPFLRSVSRTHDAFAVYYPVKNPSQAEIEALSYRIEFGMHRVVAQGLPEQLAAGEGQRVVVSQQYPEDDAWIIEDPAVIRGSMLAEAYPEFDQNGRPSIGFRMTQEGAQIFGAFTAENIGQPFAIVNGDVALSVPVIQTPIHGGAGIITGIFTIEEATSLAVLLNSGDLPYDLVVSSVTEVAATAPDDPVCPS